MTGYWLRVEALNLSNFVYDTNQISVIRGGGLRLLTEMKVVVASTVPAHELISEGASMLLLRCNDQPDIPKVEGAFRKHPTLKHATVFAATCPATTDEKFVEETETLLAEIRWKQMTSPSFSFPARVAGCHGPCEDDHLRPAGGAKKSQATDTRFELGRRARQQLCAAVAGPKLAGLSFTEDLGALAKAEEDDRSGNLNGKMAVFYADGNSFGSVRGEHCGTAKSLREWDDYIRRCRAELLSTVLTEINADTGFKTPGGLIRMETLLWGGDELLWVVPAWRGLHIAEMFYRLSKPWSFKDSRLTHAAGLVFCHHNAPIATIRTLAHDLCERAKKATDRKANAVAYQVLESFDHSGVDLDGFLSRRTPAALRPGGLLGESDPFVFSPLRLADALRLGPHRAAMSRKKVFEIRSLLAAGGSVGARGTDTHKALISKALGDLKDEPVLRSALEAFAPINAAASDPVSHQWFVLSELWDYIVEGPLAKPSGAQS